MKLNQEPILNEKKQALKDGNGKIIYQTTQEPPCLSSSRQNSSLPDTAFSSLKSGAGQVKKSTTLPNVVSIEKGLLKQERIQLVKASKNLKLSQTGRDLRQVKGTSVNDEIKGSSPEAKNVHAFDGKRSPVFLENLFVSPEDMRSTPCACHCPESKNSIASIIKNISTHTAEAKNILQKQFNRCGAEREDQVDEEGIPFKTESQSSVFQDTFPLRQTQSSPVKQNFEDNTMSLDAKHPPVIIRRSISTPATFRQSTRGSAFGRVRSSTVRKFHSNMTESIATTNIHHSAFRPVASSTSEDLGSVTEEISGKNARYQKTIKAKRRKQKERQKDKSQNPNVCVPPFTTFNGVIASSTVNIEDILPPERTIMSFSSKEISPCNGNNDPFVVTNETYVSINDEKDNSIESISNLIEVTHISQSTKSESLLVEDKNQCFETATSLFQKEQAITPEKSIISASRGETFPSSGKNNPFVANETSFTAKSKIYSDVSNLLEKKKISQSTEAESLLDEEHFGDKDISVKANKLNWGTIFDSSSTARILLEYDSKNQVGTDEHFKTSLYNKMDNVSYLPLDSRETENERDGRPPSSRTHAIFDYNSVTNAESPTPTPSPKYERFEDEQQPLIQKYHDRLLSQKISPKSNGSPSSHESCSHSRTTTRSGLSNNTTSNQTISTYLSGTASCAQTVTSSVAEADREVKETNRRERRRRENVSDDFDGTFSVISSDTASTSTHAYIALSGSPPPLRDGAVMPVDRFLSSGTRLSPIGNNSMNGRPPPCMIARSIISASSSSLANTHSSISTGEEPPFLISCQKHGTDSAERQVVKSIPPRSEANDCKRLVSDDSIVYSKLGSKLGSDEKGRHTRLCYTTKASSSRSSKQKSKTRKSQKNFIDRTPTPSPCHSFPVSPINFSSGSTPVSPPSQFINTKEVQELQNMGASRPNVFRHSANDRGKVVLFSPEASRSETRNRNIISPYGIDSEKKMAFGRMDNVQSQCYTGLEPLRENGNDRQQHWSDDDISKPQYKALVSPES